MFTIGYTAAGLLYTYIVWYVGRNWVTLNSVSDLETAYKDLLAKVEAQKAAIASEIAAGEAKVASLKALI